VQGVATCWVLMNDPGHEWARPLPADDPDRHKCLESVSGSGPARILWTAAEDVGVPPIEGARLAVVLLCCGSEFVSAWKQPARVATTANVSLGSDLEEGDTIDGVELAAGDRVLVKDQTTASDNGIYVVQASGAAVRASDADDGDELVNAVVAVSEGTANADTIWMCTADADIVIDTTDLPWVKIYPATATVDLSWKHRVRAATTTAGTLASSFETGDVIDGVTLSTGDRILIKDQRSSSENGIYVVNASGAPTRATDADTTATEMDGAVVWVMDGTQNGNSMWADQTGSNGTIWILVYPSTNMPMVGEVTGFSAGSHQFKLKYLSGGSIVDYAGPVNLTGGQSTTGSTLPNGTLVSVTPTVEYPVPKKLAGVYWLTPVAFASSTLPGFVSITSQTFKGDKTIDGALASTGLASLNTGNSDGDALNVEDAFGEALVVWSDAGAYANPGDRLIALFDNTNAGTAVLYGILGFPKDIPTASAGNKTLFFTTDDDASGDNDIELCYKDSGGTARRLFGSVNGTFTVLGAGSVEWTMKVVDGHITSLSD
jgi:phage-related tail fiber protein